MDPQYDPDYYRRIDFPVSRAWADHYEANGHIVHKSRIQERPGISSDVTPETQHKLALVMARQDEMLKTVHTMIAEQQKEIGKIQTYLNEQHREKKENAFAQAQSLRNPIRKENSDVIDNEGLDL